VHPLSRTLLAVCLCTGVANASTTAPAGTAPPYSRLFEQTYTPAESVNWYVQPDGTIVTFGSGRARSRHESENIFYTFPVRYHEHRAFGFEIHDHVAAGGNSVDIYYSPQYAHYRQPECRSAYRFPYRAAFNNNATFDPVPVVAANPDGTGQKWVCHIRRNAHSGSDGVLRVGDWMEVEFQQFLGLTDSDPVVQGQRVYYTDTYRFRIGYPGLYIEENDVLNARVSAGGAATAPWVRAGESVDQDQVISRQGDMLTYRDDAGQTVTHRILDGIETYDNYIVDSGPADYTSFTREALNTRYPTHRDFLTGRRLFHSSFKTGAHFESGNPALTTIAGLAGGLNVQESCTACHLHNGRGKATAPGQNLSTAVMKIASGRLDAQGRPEPHYYYGNTLQPRSFNAAIAAEPAVRVDYVARPGAYVDGQTYTLQKPAYTFVGGDDRLFASSFAADDPPSRGIAYYSARMPQTIAGLGLIEAIDEETLLERHDPNDADGDGVSGRVALVPDTSGAAPKIGRFGWKADKSSIRQFAAVALRNEIGVKSPLFASLDCGAAQTACATAAQSAAALTEADLQLLTTYTQMIGAPSRRPDEIDRPGAIAGEAVFAQARCGACHAPAMRTGYRHPLAELRGQDIRAYTDLLLHDLGDDLADGLSPNAADNREWRTPPLWGLGLTRVVNGEVRLLHDGRARSIEEAILWHGGEAAASRDAFRALPAASRAQLVEFLETL
jgi:CxxC motif-containing protein (DUF1111 family)